MGTIMRATRPHYAQVRYDEVYPARPVSDAIKKREYDFMSHRGAILHIALVFQALTSLDVSQTGIW